MMQSSQSGLTCRLFSVGWWLRLLAAVVFACFANHERAHLLLEAHVHGTFSPDFCQTVSAVSLESAHDSHSDHQAHPAAEHLFRAAQPAHVNPVVHDCALTVAVSDCLPPETHALLFLTERQNPPGIPPPEPFRSRAPPLA
jgi:hypothetical protein